MRLTRSMTRLLHDVFSQIHITSKLAQLQPMLQACSLIDGSQLFLHPLTSYKLSMTEFILPVS